MSRLQTIGNWLALKLWGEVDAHRLRLFEIVFTLQYLIWMGMLFLHPMEWLGEDGFHVSLADQNKGFWEPWPRLPVWGLVCFGLMLYGGAGMILFNRWKRAGLWITLLCAVYVLYADTPSAFTLTRLNIVVFAILATAPPAWQNTEGSWRQSVGPVRLLQSLLIHMYFFAGIAKTAHGDWLKHEDVILTHIQGFYRTDLAAWLVRTMPSWYWGVQKWLSLGFELLAPLLFGIRRLRSLGILLGLGFHLTIATCFWSIWPFALHMVTYYVLFLPDKAIQNIFRRSSAVITALCGKNE